MPAPNPSFRYEGGYLLQPPVLTGDYQPVHFRAFVRVFAPDFVDDFELEHGIVPSARALEDWSVWRPYLPIAETEFTYAYLGSDFMRETLPDTTVASPGTGFKVEIVSGDPVPGTDDFELGASSYDPDTGYWTILIHESVGTTRPNWDTERAVMDVMAHELGHIVLYMIVAAYEWVGANPWFGPGPGLGEPTVREALRSIFEAPDAPFNSGPWQGRLVESFAEQFKDTYLLPEWRNYCNRTDHKLREAMHEEFLLLIDGMLQDQWHGFTASRELIERVETAVLTPSMSLDPDDFPALEEITEQWSPTWNVRWKIPLEGTGVPRDLYYGFWWFDENLDLMDTDGPFVFAYSAEGPQTPTTFTSGGTDAVVREEEIFQAAPVGARYVAFGVAPQLTPWGNGSDLDVWRAQNWLNSVPQFGAHPEFPPPCGVSGSVIITGHQAGARRRPSLPAGGFARAS